MFLRHFRASKAMRLIDKRKKQGCKVGRLFVRQRCSLLTIQSQSWSSYSGYGNVEVSKPPSMWAREVLEFFARGEANCFDLTLRICRILKQSLNILGIFPINLYRTSKTIINLSKLHSRKITIILENCTSQIVLRLALVASHAFAVNTRPR